jgi:hypothetical protein
MSHPRLRNASRTPRPDALGEGDSSGDARRPLATETRLCASAGSSGLRSRPGGQTPA